MYPIIQKGTKFDHGTIEMNTVTRILSEPQMRRPSPEMMTVIHPRSTSRSMSLIGMFELQNFGGRLCVERPNVRGC